MKKDGKYAFILDPDEFVGLSLVKILQKYGFQVEKIEDLSSLTGRKRDITHGIVLADVEVEVLEKEAPLLRGSEDHFVLMSPHITDELKIRLKKLGIRRIMRKPVEPRVLKRVIRGICPEQEEGGEST